MEREEMKRRWTLRFPDARHWTRGLGIGLVVCLVGAPMASAGGYAPVVIRIGNLVVKATAGLTPSNLPKDNPVPIKARVRGTVHSVDGSHVPPATKISVDIDKDFAIHARGFPTCSLSRITAVSTAEALKACRPALVGSGSAIAEVALPEQAPFTARGPLLFFNGGIRGKKTLLFVHLYAAVPAPTAIVAKVVLTPIHEGRYGTRASATVPKIAGGYGSIIGFSFSIGRDLPSADRSKGYLEASCPGTRYLTRAEVTFADGVKYRAGFALPCRGSTHAGYSERRLPKSTETAFLRIMSLWRPSRGS